MGYLRTLSVTFLGDATKVWIVDRDCVLVGANTQFQYAHISKDPARDSSPPEGFSFSDLCLQIYYPVQLNHLLLKGEQIFIRSEAAQTVCLFLAELSAEKPA